ncbi:MAG: group 1 glycosyl transferase [bacterium (Candidatus Stahlbacteria) CG23_combo_of_CG06-09_8_20_14_all_40_9]|nr:MAG: group 1 glycosyl transferase [bacterium (Candidatus Stahlbacteria) CG23_combo_of_CG06-09_8_20_14_all_40_9]
MRVLFITQTDELGPASRYRVYQYLPYLTRENIEYKVIPGGRKYYYHIFKKPFYYLDLLLRRIRDLTVLNKFDVIFIQREFIPKMYPFGELLYSKINENLIFDFDDAIYVTSKYIYKVLQRSKIVIAGNTYLKEYAQKYNKNVVVIPTCIDISRYSLKQHSPKEEVTIGWIGTPSNLGYLKSIFPIIQELSRKFRVILKIIGIPSVKSYPGVNIKSQKWLLNEEISDILSMDIGIMPLPNNKYTKGKCGVKLLQYMAAGLPAVTSQVGVGEEIITSGFNGFLANDKDSWYNSLKLLIENWRLRKDIGIMARRTVEEKFALGKSARKFIEVIQKVAI